MERIAPHVCVVNLGCRVNRVESDWMESSFVQSGAVLCAEDEADIIAINTCAVTGEAQAKTRKAVRRAASLPKHPLVAVTGCVANLFPAELEAIGDNVRVLPAKLVLVEDALGEWGKLNASAAGEGNKASLSGALFVYNHENQDALVENVSSGAVPQARSAEDCLSTEPNRAPTGIYQLYSLSC